MEIRDAYVEAATSTLHLLRDPDVEAAWEQPSALAEFSVGGLAAHLAHQVLSVPSVVGATAPEDEPIPLLGHYERATWRGAKPDAEINVGIRAHADGLAAAGAQLLADRVGETISTLPALLSAQPPERAVRTPSGPWSLRLDDFLVTRMMEIAVHSDDLAYSVGVEAPPLPDAVLRPVLGLLTGLAVREHGQAALLRALARAERAPGAINAL
jgi:hypothetical protein